MSARLGASVWIASLLTLGLVASALRGEPPQEGASPADKTDKDVLMVAISTEPNGYLTPCGCSKPMLGGFPRRASLLRSFSSQAALVKIENGDLTQALGRQDELKAETLVEMYNQLDYEALNVGEKDFRLGLPYLQSLQKRFKGALLSANVRTMEGAALFDELTVVTKNVAGRSVRVVITGLLSEQYHEAVKVLNPELNFDSPATTLQRLRPQLMARGEVRLLLYHGPMAEAEELAQQFPIFTLIVCGHEGDHPVENKRVGNTMLMCSGQDGKYLGSARLNAAKNWQVEEAKSTALGPEWKDDPSMLRTKQIYSERVTAEDLLGKVIRRPTTNGDTFAGNAACAACHAEAQRVWKASGHARALQTLTDIKQDKDPECVVCHVVGLDRQGGFISREKTPKLADVGCESCHGAGMQHGKDPTKARMPKVGSNSCIGCHNPENSPHFEFEKYWPKIKH